VRAFSSADEWGVEEKPLRDNVKEYQLFAPVNEAIAYHKSMKAYLYEKAAGRSIQTKEAEPFNLIFNPFPDNGDGFADDQVYNPAFTPAEREHYVRGDASKPTERDTGYNYEGMGRVLSYLRRIDGWIATYGAIPQLQNWKAALSTFAANPDRGPLDLLDLPTGPERFGSRSPWILDSGDKKVFELAMARAAGTGDALQAMRLLANETTKVIRGCWGYDVTGAPPGSPDPADGIVDDRDFQHPDYCGDEGYGRDFQIRKRKLKDAVAGWYNLPEMASLYLSSGRTKRPLGQCLDYAGLASGLARAVGIPARQVTCTLLPSPNPMTDPQPFSYHAWTEVWVKDPSNTNATTQPWLVADGAEIGSVDTRFNATTQGRNIRWADHVYTYNAQARQWSDVLNTYKGGP